MTKYKKAKQKNFKKLKLKFPELDFSNSKYLGDKIKLKYLCAKHGLQEDTPNALNRKSIKVGCKKCRIKKNIGIYNSMYITPENKKRKVMKIHGDKYSYCKTDFLTTGLSKNIVTCKVHGDFNITLNNHNLGRGCPQCAIIENREKTLGWKHSTWSQAGKISKNFLCFMVYKIKCYDVKSGEVFFKIGKTYVGLKKRFSGASSMPYKYEILNIVKGDAKEMCILEEKLKKQNKKNKYIPKLPFGGQHECFSKLIDVHL